jgi:cytochrome bd-type quinol oxidase subunit 2
MQMKNKKKILAVMLLVFLMSLFFILPPVQAADNCSGVVGCIPETGLSKQEIKPILVNLLNWLLGIVGIIAIMGFVVSGIMYLVSAGNEEMVTKAKKYMLYCLIGVVVVLASFVVIKTIDSILNASIV